MKISKKTAKIINIILIVLAILMLASNFVLASEGFDGYAPITAKESDLQGSVTKVASSILGIAQTVGMAVAVIMLIVVAIKYISASPNDKASIKQQLIVYIVGAIVLFAASGLVALIRNWVGETI